MAKNYVQEGDVIDYANASGSTITSGTPVLIGARLGVALADIANGATGSVQVEGVFTVTKLGTDTVAPVRCCTGTTPTSASPPPPLATPWRALRWLRPAPASPPSTSRSTPDLR